ncbi:MAG: hypothetical protein J5589_12320 [Firmicutes bacterium]|nr:hypothetical protein [Bacillota bacterium]
MGRKRKQPELCVHRKFTNERPIEDVFADAYRMYFEEKLKSSVRTFDSGKSFDYNETTYNQKEESSYDGSTA